MKALVFGEVLWDIYPDQKVIGGAPFNFASHLSLLGHDVALVSAVGDDALGEETRACIRQMGVSDRFVATVGQPTGRCLVTLDIDGLPQYDLCRDVAYDYIPLTPQRLAELDGDGAELLYFNTLAQRHPISRAAIRTILDAIPFREIVCDLNIRPNGYDADSVNLCLSRATILKVSAEEAHFLAELGLVPSDIPLADALRASFLNLRLLIYTMGGEGSTVYDLRDGRVYRSGKPEAVEVVSTVGAGDCYAATFVDRYCRGATIDQAIQAATARSSLVVADIAAIPVCLIHDA